ncbi:MAG TPA: glucose-6-phosphate isomerase family protein [Capillimicrobium sp.]|nr:glucose-6-phosphate isomerase family protein [Capillimicrobium sp.]
MTNLTTDPFRLVVDERGELKPATSTVRRRLSDMAGMYADAEAERALLAEDDALVYEVHQYDVPEYAGELVACTTILYPGKVGDEYFMTKGHFHEVRDRAEIYYGLKGSGQLVLAKDDASETVGMEPGVVAYVPPHWAHRTVNTGDEPFVFLAIYPGDAGHDYGTIETEGFPQRIVERDGAARVVPAGDV